MDSFEVVRDKTIMQVSHIDGWLGTNEAHLLFELARCASPEGCVVEIGSWKGKSTILLATAVQIGPRIPVVAIDPHINAPPHPPGLNTEQEFRENLRKAGVSDQVEVIVATSQQAAVGWNRPISFLWIDGDHSYEGAKLDWMSWKDHVLEGGVIAFHDTFLTEGPERVVSEHMIPSNSFSDLGYAGTITYAIKRHNLTRIQVIRKRLKSLKRTFYGLRLRGGLPTSIYFYLKALEDRSDTPAPIMKMFAAFKWLRRRLGLKRT